MRGLKRMVDYGDPTSLGSRLRLRRFAHFRGLLAALSTPLTILDLGGTATYWRSVGFPDRDGIRIVLLNRRPVSTPGPAFESVTGDARSLPQYGDGSFDVVYSNSVIEHVGGAAEQRQMAAEMQRVGRRFYLQTPNFAFPFEPHFLFPGYQYLPLAVRGYLLRHWRLGHYGPIADPLRAREAADSIRLLTRRQLRGMFPDASVRAERVLGLAKSWLVYGGWEAETRRTDGTDGGRPPGAGQ